MNINNFFICYYSGTGNSYLTALHIQQALENSKLYDLLTYRGEKLACKTLMIVFPVHMYGAPPIVLDFIKQLDVNQDTLIYAIATCGGISGEALWQVDQALNKRGLHLAKGYVVRMPRTYIVEFTIQSERKQLALLEQMKKKATQMTKEINEGKKKRRSFRMKLSRWIYDPIYQRKTYEWNRQDINFWTSSQCIKCGKCTQLCPVGNIELKQEKIIWKHQCLGCFRCVHGCPREAIEYGKNTIGRRRYKNLVLKNKEWYKIGD